MCSTLAGVQEGFRAWLADFDASRLSGVEAAELVGVAAWLERAAAGLVAQLSARSSGGAEGGLSAAHRLAAETGLSLGAAGERLATGRVLAGLPGLAAAANTGALSAPQLAAISDAAAVEPACAGRLVALAGRASLGELQQACRRTKAAADRDAQARRARIHAGRRLRHYQDRDGTAHLHLADNPEVVAGVIAALGPTRDRLAAAARAAGRVERADALAADALVTLIHAAVGRGAGSAAGSDGAGAGGGGGPDGAVGVVVPAPPAKILIRVDFDTLLRGYPTGGEVCEIAGLGPVPVSAVHDLIATADPVLVALATRGQQVCGVARLRRRPDTAQLAALQWAQPECQVEGCHRCWWLQTDHRIPHCQTKITLLEGLDRLCSAHHQQKTRLGYALLEGVGKRPFVPPTDPRHPKHRRHQNRPPPV